jgi:hypothetical protein
MTTFTDLFRENFDGDGRYFDLPTQVAGTSSSPDRPQGNSFGDLLWFRDDGSAEIWLMNQDVRQGDGTPLPNNGPTSHLKAAVDFDHSGFPFSDLLWQNDNGAVAIWQMQGTTILQQTDLPSPGPSLHVVAANDFDGNTGADVLFQHDNGQLLLWLMQDSSHIGAQINIDQNPDASWHAVATGDFNGDGKAGILLQNDNGAVQIWENLQSSDGQNGQFKLQAGVGNNGPTWHVKAAADFDGDGRADILWQNDNGAAAIWLINGTQLDVAGTRDIGPTWHIVGARDMNGDGSADLLWQNDNGQAAIWENFTPGPGQNVASFSTQLDISPNPNPADHVGDTAAASSGNPGASSADAKLSAVSASVAAGQAGMQNPDSATIQKLNTAAIPNVVATPGELARKGDALPQPDQGTAIPHMDDATAQQFKLAIMAYQQLHPENPVIDQATAIQLLQASIHPHIDAPAPVHHPEWQLF